MEQIEASEAPLLKRFDLDAKPSKFNDYMAAVRAKASKKGLSAMFNRQAQPEELQYPHIAMAGDIPEQGFNLNQWAIFSRNLFEKKLCSWSADKAEDDKKYELSGAIAYEHLWDSGQEQVASVMREPIPRIRFLTLLNKIEQEWMPRGEYTLSELRDEFTLLTDITCNGVLDLFRGIELQCQRIQVVDATQEPNEADKKRQLVKGITTKFFKDQLLSHISDPEWSYEYVEKTFRAQIRADDKLDENRRAGVVKVNFAPSFQRGTCFNCGEVATESHRASTCPHLTCGYCKEVFSSLATRHTSSNCPVRLAENTKTNRGKDGPYKAKKANAKWKNGYKQQDKKKEDKSAKKNANGNEWRKATASAMESMCVNMQAVANNIDDIQKKMKRNDIC